MQEAGILEVELEDLTMQEIIDETNENGACQKFRDSLEISKRTSMPEDGKIIRRCDVSIREHNTRVKRG